MMSHSFVSLAAAAPAKGAPISDLLWASLVATVLSAGVLWVAIGHRSGRIRWLGRLAELSERKSGGLPGWAALPTAVVGASLLVAVLGFYWDVAKHIDTGRDQSPFGTPAHYPILLGLAGITLGGFLAIVLGADRRRVPTAIRLADDWYAPLGGVLVFACGAFALIGFPLDDVWHTLFGQDVTLWGPTHILMVGGASLSTLGVWVLLVEAKRAGPTGVGRSDASRWLVRLREPAIAGAFLIGLSTLQGEFDYGVPQFQLVYQPILIMLAAGCGLVAARVRLGRGGALFAALFYCATFTVLSFAVHDALGEVAVLHFPLYLVEAALVELVALRIPRQRPLALALSAGAAIGTVGLAAEWGWSHLWMPLPWPTSLLPEAAILGLAAALAGATIGALIGRPLNGDAVGRVPVRSFALPVAAIVAVFCIAFPLPMTSGSQTTVSARLHTVHPGPERTVAGTFRIAPTSATADPQWLTALAWQGGGLVNDRLAEVRPGLYRTTEPIPAAGDWKAILRLANGRALQAAPIYLPNDPAIPAKGSPAKARFTRPFVRDKEILQREYTGGPLWLSLPAYLIVFAVASGWLVMLGLGLRRLGGGERPRLGGRDRSPAALAASGGTA
jgi:hypothetical protein